MKPIQVIGVLMIVGAVLLAFGAFSNKWLEGGDETGSGSIGLRHIEDCTQSKGCETEALEKLMTDRAPTRAKVWVFSGKLTFFLGLATGLASIIFGVTVLTGRRLFSSFIPIALAGAGLVTTVMFMMLLDDKLSSMFSRGLAFYAYVAGVLAVVSASIGGFKVKDEPT